MKKRKFSLSRILSILILLSMILSINISQFAFADTEMRIVFDYDYADVGMPITARVENAADGTKLNYCWRVDDIEIPDSNSDTYILKESDREKFIDVIIIAQPGGLIRNRIYFSVLPVIYIQTEDGNEIDDRDVYKNAYMRIQGNAEYNSQTGEMYDNIMEIKGRGNYTWTYPVKPYKLKLNKKTDLFGFGKNKHFVLLPDWVDPTKLASRAALYLADEQTDDYITKMTSVVVMFNGRYDGVYSLSENVRVDDVRVNIYDWEGTGESIASIIGKAEKLSEDDITLLEENMVTNVMWITDKYVDFKGERYNFSNYPAIDFPDITTAEGLGGFLAEIDLHHKLESKYETPFKDIPIQFRNPEFLNTNPVFFNNTKGFIDAFERAMDSPDFHSMYNGVETYYGDLFDMNSLVTYYMVNEITMNFDAMLGSTFFYKDVGKPAKFGPPWDYEKAFSFRSNGDAGYHSPYNWSYKCFSLWIHHSRNYYKSFMKDPYFLAKLFEHYHSIRPTIIEELYGTGGWLDREMEEMKLPGAANYARWYGESKPEASYIKELNKVKDYIKDKTNWLDIQFDSMPKLIESTGSYSTVSSLMVDDIDTESVEGKTIINASSSDFNIRQLMFLINGRKAGTIILDENNNAQITIPDSYLEKDGKINVVEIKGLNSNGGYVMNGSIPRSNYSTFYKELPQEETSNIVINQVFGGGGKSDSKVSNSFIELLNPTNKTINLTGWKLKYENAGDGKSGVIELNVTLNSGEKYFIKGYTEKQTVSTFPIVKFTDNDDDCDLYIEDFILGNKNCRIDLLDDKGNIIDGFGRGTLSSAISEGLFSVPEANKHTIYTRTDGVDTNSAVDFRAYNFNAEGEIVLIEYNADGYMPKRTHTQQAYEIVIKLINSISEPVTVNDTKTVEKAREAYDLLDGDEQTRVTNYNKLTDAEQTLEYLKTISVRKKGFVTNNGKENDITIKDAIEIFRCLAEKITLENGNKWAADINDNGEIEIIDAIWIFKYLSDKVTLDELQNVK